MNEDLFSGERSSLFVGTKALAGFAALSVISAVFDFSALSAAFAFLFFFCLASRLWGEGALSRVEVEAEGTPTALFPGGEVELRVKIKNDKWLPVIWLELLQPLGTQDALVPEGETVLAVEGERFLSRKFTFVMGREEIFWTSRWKAERRGLFRPEQMLLRAGDGFGLTQAQRGVGGRGRHIAVYPARQNISAEPFLRDMWDAVGGAKGYLEDPTVIKSTRDYQMTDPFKRLNFRLTARLQRPVVNTYETILPKSAHFIVDCESFNGENAESEAFEDTLSILTSLLLRLQEAEVRCGVSLPQSRRKAAVDLVHSERTPLAQILYAFAAYEFRPLQRTEDPHDPPFAPPPVFREEQILSLENVGRYYYVCFSPEKVKKNRLLHRLDGRRTVLLPYTLPQEDEAWLREFTVVGLTTLKRGDGRGT